jgi:acyl-ACP thioesterase
MGDEDMYTFSSKVRYSEVGQNGLLTITSAINYFQDCGAFQFEDLGLGVEYAKQVNRACLASSWQFIIKRLPAIGEKIMIGSIIYDCKGIFGYRNYIIFDEMGERIIDCNSIGVFVDATTGTPVKLSQEDIKRYPIEEKLDMEYLPRKIAIPQDMEVVGKFSIHKYHIDTNNHVNNAQYVAMAEEFLPAGYVPEKVRVEYKSPAVYGDIMLAKVNQCGQCYIVELCDEQDKTYAVVEFNN